VVWTSILVEEEMKVVQKGEGVVEDMPLRRYQSHATTRRICQYKAFLALGFSILTLQFKHSPPMVFDARFISCLFIITKIGREKGETEKHRA